MTTEKSKKTTERNPKPKTTSTSVFDFSAEKARADQELKDGYLAAYAEFGQIGKACIAAGISRSQVERWREVDPEFNTRYHDIHQELIDSVEATLPEIALDKEASPSARVSAAKIFLQAHRPEGYRPQSGDGMRHAPTINLILGAPPKQDELPPGPTHVIDTKAG